MEESQTTVIVGEQGPLIIKGGATIVDKDGNEEKKEGTVALCRCGLSANKPYCDGAHKEFKNW